MNGSAPAKPAQPALQPGAGPPGGAVTERARLAVAFSANGSEIETMLRVGRVCIVLCIFSILEFVYAEISADKFQYHCGKKLRVAFNTQEPYIIVDTTKVTNQINLKIAVA